MVLLIKPYEHHHVSRKGKTVVRDPHFKLISNIGIKNIVHTF